MHHQHLPIVLRKGKAAIILGLLTILLGVLGFFLIFTSFASADDEGLVLYALRSVLEGHALYDEVYTQYGPGYFLIHGLLFKGLHLSIAHDTIGLITLLFWLSGSLAIALGVYRFTHRTSLAAIALLGSFLVAAAMRSEPGHPQAMLYNLASLTVILASDLPKLSAWGTLGAIAGLCFITKVNLGALICFSLGWVWLQTLTPKPWQLLVRVIFGFGLLLLPWVLMAPRLEDSTIWRYAAIAIATNFNGLLLSRTLEIPPSNRVSRDRLNLPENWLMLISLGLGFSLTCALGLAFAWMGGTTISGLYQGIIGQHLGFDRVFWLNPPFKGWKILLNAILASLVCLAYTQWLSSKRPQPPFLRWSIPLIKGLFAVVALSLLLQLPFGLGLQYRSGYLMPWMWLVAVSPPHFPEARDRQLGRYTLLSLATLQFLIAYPVAGSQLAFATIFIVPISCILLRDALVELRSLSFPTPLASRIGRTISSQLAPFFAAVAIAIVSYRAIPTLQAYQQGKQPISLAGSSLLRLPATQLALYAGLTQNVRANAEALLTLPGLYSFCLWSEIDSPTLLNQTNWPFAFDDATQTAIAREIDHIPRVVVIRHDGLVNVWGKGQSAHSRPLVQYIDRHFIPIASLGGYQFLVRDREKDRVRAIGGWWVTEELPPIIENANLQPDRNKLSLARIDLPPIPATLHRLEIENLTDRTPVPIEEFADGTQIGAIEADGTLSKLTVAELAASGLTLEQPRQLLIPLEKQSPSSSEALYLVRIFDRSDNLLLRLPFLTRPSPKASG